MLDGKAGSTAVLTGAVKGNGSATLHLLVVNYQPAPSQELMGLYRPVGGLLLCLLLATYKTQTFLCWIRHLGRVKTHLFECLQHREASTKDRLKEKKKKV